MAVSSRPLGEDAQRLLLRVARDSLRLFLGSGQVPRLNLESRFESDPEHPACAQCGAFVTIHRDTELRGCIGYLEPRGPLWEAVAELVLSAACRDSRFSPIQPSELLDLRIEISAMSPLAPVLAADEIVVGRDGLVIHGAGARGVLLPQVAVHHGWGRDEFVEQVCRKAGLPERYWPENGELLRFSAAVFNETRLGCGGDLPPLGVVAVSGK